MSKTLAIAGAGIMGRMLALAFHRRGWQVALYDRDDAKGHASCSWAAVGILAAYGSQGLADPAISELGTYSLEQWPAWLESLALPVYYRSNGAIAVAHPRDVHELNKLAQRLIESDASEDVVRELDHVQLEILEPELARRFQRGLYFPLEQHIDNRQLMESLGETIRREGITWHTCTEVTRLEPHRIHSSRGDESFEWIIDARGLGARADYPELFGVRGEAIRVKAPAVSLSRPVRIMHPRYAIYIVPREGDVYVIGATSEQQNGMGEISVRSAMELLSAAYTLHPGFGDASILETSVNCRPCFPNQRPRIIPRQGLLAVNGLFRFGFLVAPALSDIVVNFIDNGETHPLGYDIMDEWTL